MNFLLNQYSVFLIWRFLTSPVLRDSFGMTGIYGSTILTLLLIADTHIILYTKPTLFN